MIIFDSLTEKIINKVTEANLAYRSGNPIMGDQEYDDLLDSLKSKITEDEYENLVSSLNEGSVEPNSDGKVKHLLPFGFNLLKIVLHNFSFLPECLECLKFAVSPAVRLPFPAATPMPESPWRPPTDAPSRSNRGLPA